MIGLEATIYFPLVYGPSELIQADHCSVFLERLVMGRSGQIPHTDASDLLGFQVDPKLPELISCIYAKRHFHLNSN